MFLKLNQISISSGIPIISFGHAGDGNIHVNILVEKGNEEEKTQGFELVKKIFEYAVNLGGAISGEHGIGITKKPYIDIQLSRKNIELMRAVKRVFDPKEIMNPGKIF